MQARVHLIRYVIFLILISAAWIPFNRMLGPVDDSYITARYADNLGNGHGIVFNHDEKIEGCTAFGLMALLAPFAALGFMDLVKVSQILGMLCWALVCTVTFALIRKRGGKKLSGLEGFSAVYLVFCLAPLVWVYAGMETPLVAAFWIGAAAFHLRENEKGAWPIFSALCTVGAGLMHPDGILIAVVIGLSLLIPWSKKRFARTSVYSAIVLSLFGGYWLWRWSYFGYPLPNTFYAKVGAAGSALFFHGLYYVAKGFVTLGVPIGATVLCFRLVTRFKQVTRETWIYFGVCVISSAYVLYVGGDFFPFVRFFIPPLAFWLLLMISLWRTPSSQQAREDEKPESGKGPGWILTGAMIFIALTTINIAGAVTQKQISQHTYLVKITREWSRLGRRLNETLPENATIATIPIGALGYWSDRYIIDMLGLIDLHIARADVETGKGVIGHEKFDTEYVLNKKPDIIMTWPVILGPTPKQLLRWNQNNLLSDAQSDMIERLKNNPEYVTCAIPIADTKAFFVIAHVRADLKGLAPYNAWPEMPKEANKLIFADVKQMRRLLGQQRKSGF